MIWILLILAVIALSTALALSSMSEYQDLPGKEHSLFLIRNPQSLDLNILKKNRIYSLERLTKGKDRVLVIFADKSIIQEIPNLNLLELEDYSRDLEEKMCLCFEVKKTKNKLTKLDFYHNINLNNNEQIVTQVVTEKVGDNYQSNIRILICADNFERRAVIAKALDEVIKDMGLKRENKSTSECFKSFKNRSLRPKEVSKMLLSVGELYTLIK